MKSEIKQDKTEALLARAQREQAEFENHWLWRELGTTPKLFAAQIQKTVEHLGISPEEWQHRLSEQAAIIRTKASERAAGYKMVNFKNFNGLRA